MGQVKGEPGADSDAKPETTKHQITIRFSGADEDLSILVKSTMRFEKVYKAVAEQKGIAPGSFRLHFDGKRVNNNDTPQSLEMEDEEQLDFLTEQVGGAALHA